MFTWLRSVLGLANVSCGALFFYKWQRGRATREAKGMRKAGPGVWWDESENLAG